MGQHGTTLLLTALLALGAGGFAGLVWLKVTPPPEDVEFTGSSACAPCHPKVAAVWAESQHTKMMRPASEPGVVVADLDAEGVGTHFDVNEIVWAIGGKWEQQLFSSIPGFLRSRSSSYRLSYFPDGWLSVLIVHPALRLSSAKCIDGGVPDAAERGDRYRSAGPLLGDSAFGSIADRRVDSLSVVLLDVLSTRSRDREGVGA